MLRSLNNLIRDIRTAKKARPARRAPRRVNMQLENLADRMLMASAILSPTGTLQVNADPGLYGISFGGHVNPPDRILCSAAPTIAPGPITRPSTATLAAPSAIAPANAASNGSVLYTPAQIDKAYGFDKLHSQGLDGTGQTIAIIEAYDVAHSQSDAGDLQHDLDVFDAQFGLSSLTLGVQYEGGFTSTTSSYSLAVVAGGGQNGNVHYNAPPRPPTTGFDWTREAALDVEWAHAIAPGANIIVFEANSASTADMMATVSRAVNTPGVSVVSMSFGNVGGEDLTTEQYEAPYFTTPPGHAPITFIASSGDDGVLESPATVSNVLAVGGTTLTLAADGTYGSETAWSGSGGGFSLGVTRPSYQPNMIDGVTIPDGRIVPDVAYGADPNTGFQVFDTRFGWDSGAGTSAGAPQWAGLIALANQSRQKVGLAPLANAIQDLYQIPGDFHDITSGGTTGLHAAYSGYDAVTGLGSPRADLIVPALKYVEITVHVPLPHGSVNKVFFNSGPSTGVSATTSNVVTMQASSQVAHSTAGTRTMQPLEAPTAVTAPANTPLSLTNTPLSLASASASLPSTSAQIADNNLPGSLDSARIAAEMNALVDSVLGFRSRLAEEAKVLMEAVLEPADMGLVDAFLVDALRADSGQAVG